MPFDFFCFLQKQSEEAQGKLAYTVLLILTAGAVDNVQETFRALEKASEAPLSIIIVGIGEGDFDAMEYLDADADTVSGIDITQFVRFNDYRIKSTALTDALLDEVPDQLVDYFTSKNIQPGAPEKYDAENAQVQAADGDDRFSHFFEVLAS